MQKNKMKTLYVSFMTAIAKLIFPRPNFIFEEEPVEGEPCVFLANHSGADGPAYATLYFAEPKKMWLINYVVNRDKNADFIFHDFFAAANKKHKKPWRLLAKITAFFLTPLLESTQHIKVYHDARMLDTFRDSVEALAKGENLVIFPECPTGFSPYLNELYSGFSELGRLYYTSCGKLLRFYPTYICKDLKTVSVGKPIIYDPSVPARKEREIISKKVRDGIVSLAEKLPKHKIHPFLTDEWYECYGEYADNPIEYWKKFD